MAQPIDPRLIKPGKAGYWIGLAIAVVCIVIGVIGFVVGIGSAVKHVPTLSHKSTDGAAAAVRLSTGEKFALYLPQAAPTGTTCHYTPNSGIVADGTSGSVTFTSDGEQWTLFNNLHATEGATYTFDCDGVPFAIGNQLEVGKFAGGIGLGLGSLFGLPCLGLIVGGIFALVTGLRRSSSKKRLQEQGPQGPPMGYYSA